MKRTREQVYDEWLVLRSQQGERAALEELLQRWQGRLGAHARRLLGDPEAAGDALQEAFVAIARGLGRLKDPAQFRSWCYRIVGNKCADWIRAEQRRRRVVEELEREPDLVRRDEADQLTLAQAIAELSGPHRALLSMFYQEGLNVREIAEALGVPPGTVKSRLFHLRRTLTRLVNEEEEHEICG